MFTPYASIGYNSSKSSFKIDGNYAVGALELNSEELTNIEYESKTEIRANLGFRFNILSLHYKQITLFQNTQLQH